MSYDLYDFVATRLGLTMVLRILFVVCTNLLCLLYFFDFIWWSLSLFALWFCVSFIVGYFWCFGQLVDSGVVLWVVFVASNLFGWLFAVALLWCCSVLLTGVCLLDGVWVLNGLNVLPLFCIVVDYWCLCLLV